MRLPGVKVTVRWMMVAVATVAGITFAATREREPPEAVLRSAKKEVPGIKIQRIRPEVFGGRRAWEVKGIDGEGVIWLIDVSGSGEVLMKEPIYDTANNIPVGAISPVEDPRWGLQGLALTHLESRLPMPEMTAVK